MLAVFCFFLLLSISLFVWDLTKKSHDENSQQYETIELFQYSCNMVLNLIIAVCLLICIRNFFTLLSERFGGHVTQYLTSLKCALCTLCVTFFLRSFLMLVLVL